MAFPGRLCAMRVHWLLVFRCREYYHVQEQRLLRQLVADSDHIRDLSHQRAAGDESQSLKLEIDTLQEAIQIKVALVSGMQELPGLPG